MSKDIHFLGKTTMYCQVVRLQSETHREIDCGSDGSGHWCCFLQRKFY